MTSELASPTASASSLAAPMSGVKIDGGPAHSLLIVDDEPGLCTVLAEYFGLHGYRVRTAASAEEARVTLVGWAPQLAILDVNMPGEDGLSLARWLRQSQPGVGIVMLTTVSATVDRTIGLEQGADDYLPKPFEMRELLARVRAVLRRVDARVAAQAAPGRAQPNVVPFGKFMLDLDAGRLLGPGGDAVPLSGAEFELLAHLARHPNRPQSRDQILQQVRSRGGEVFDRSIDLRMMRLRRKIEDRADKPQFIKTVRNVGYVFVPARAP